MFPRPAYGTQVSPFLHNKGMHTNLNPWLSTTVWQNDILKKERNPQSSSANFMFQNVLIKNIEKQQEKTKLTK